MINAALRVGEHFVEKFLNPAAPVQVVLLHSFHNPAQINSLNPHARLVPRSASPKGDPFVE